MEKLSLHQPEVYPVDPFKIRTSTIPIVFEFLTLYKSEGTLFIMKLYRYLYAGNERRDTFGLLSRCHSFLSLTLPRKVSQRRKVSLTLETNSMSSKGVSHLRRMSLGKKSFNHTIYRMDIQYKLRFNESWKCAYSFCSNTLQVIALPIITSHFSPKWPLPAATAAYYYTGVLFGGATQLLSKSALLSSRKLLYSIFNWILNGWQELDILAFRAQKGLLQIFSSKAVVKFRMYRMKDPSLRNSMIVPSTKSMDSFQMTSSGILGQLWSVLLFPLLPH